jgi:hypothetical protein
MPTIDIPDKICPCCGGTIWKIQYKKQPIKDDPNRIKEYIHCAVRSQEILNTWKEKNSDKLREYWKVKSIEQNKIRKESGYWKTSKMRERSRLKAKKDSDKLSNHYIINKLVQNHNAKNTIKLDASDIPQEMIEIKRKQLQLTRQIRELCPQ